MEPQAPNIQAIELRHLRELTFQRFKFLDREQALRDATVQLLQRLMEDKLKEMNGLRDENRTIQKEMVSREEYKVAHERLAEQVGGVWKFIYLGLGAGIVVQMLVGALIVYFFKPH